MIKLQMKENATADTGDFFLSWNYSKTCIAVFNMSTCYIKKKKPVAIVTRLKRRKS